VRRGVQGQRHHPARAAPTLTDSPDLAVLRAMWRNSPLWRLQRLAG